MRRRGFRRFGVSSASGRPTGKDQAAGGLLLCYANRPDAIVESAVARAGQVAQVRCVGRDGNAPPLEVLVTIEGGRPSGQYPDGRHTLTPARYLSLFAIRTRT